MSPVEKARMPGDNEPAAKKAAEEMAQRAAQKHAPTPAVPGGPKPLAEHTVKKGETLSGIALKYYGSADKEKWMKIYEANKAVIGADPGLIKEGQVLKIPA